MSKRKRIALAVVSAAFTAVGLAAFAFDSEERFSGALTALFFGSCLLVFVAPLFERRRKGRERAVVSYRGQRTEALVFPSSRATARTMGIAAALWALVGAALLVHPAAWTDPGESTGFLRVLGVALVLFFGAGALFVFVQERRGGGFVALLPDGILARAGLSRTFVPWDAIEFVGIVEMYDQRMVAVRVTDPSAVETPGWARVFSRLNRSMLDADVFYASLTVPEEELQAAIVDRLEHPEKRTRPEDP